MDGSAQAADRAADYADRRARDTDRLSRWMVGITLAVAFALFGAIGTLVYQVAALATSAAGRLTS